MLSDLLKIAQLISDCDKLVPVSVSLASQGITRQFGLDCIICEFFGPPTPLFIS